MGDQFGEDPPSVVTWKDATVESRGTLPVTDATAIWGGEVGVT